MRKWKLVLLMLVFCMISTSCGSEKKETESKDVVDHETFMKSLQDEKKEQEKEEIVDITEKMYVTYVNEIYVNMDDYIGKTIRLEGMYLKEYWEETKKNYYYVYREGPGCCSTDGTMCGFEFTFTDDVVTAINGLEDKDWIEVTGVLTSYEENGQTYLSLEAKSVVEKEERGKESIGM